MTPKIEKASKHLIGAMGIIEVSFYTTAVVILDEMLKASQVVLVACEKKLGGRLVSLMIAGEVSAVQSAIETAQETGKKIGQEHIKVAVMISNPHPEIIKLLNRMERPKAARRKRESEKMPIPQKPEKIPENSEIQ